MAVNHAMTTRKLVSLPHALVSAVEDFQFKSRIKTESEAIRQLIEAGLKAAGVVTLEQLIAYCRKHRRDDLAEIVKALADEARDPDNPPGAPSLQASSSP